MLVSFAITMVVFRMCTDFAVPLVKEGPARASASDLVAFMASVGNSVETRISFMVAVVMEISTSSVDFLANTDFFILTISTT